MSLMSALYVGTSGLQTSQNAVNTVAHNLSNIDTKGYTRQQVLQSDKHYNEVGRDYVSSQQVGLGVNYAQVRQVRDYFLDRAYRLEAGRTSFYENSYKIATEVNTLFGEMEGVQFQSSLQDLWTATQELQKDPGNATYEGLFVNSAVTFLERAQSIYNGLSSYQDNINKQIKDTVATINSYSDRILELNTRISGIEAGRQEKANDLRDARNQLIDELASYGRVVADEDINGQVTVQFEGHDFIAPGYANPIMCEEDPETGFYSIVWGNDSHIDGSRVEVFNLNREISTSTDTDVGGLKALVLLRGDDRGTYTDIPQQSDYYNDDGSFNTDVYSNLQAAKDAYEKSVTHYNYYTGNSLLKNTMAELDTLVHGIATQMNDLLNPTVTDVVKDGVNISYNVNKKADGNYEYTDEDGVKHTVAPSAVYKKGISVFLRRGTLDDEKSTKLQAEAEDVYRADTDLTGDGKVTEDDLKRWKAINKSTWYSINNLKVNPILLQQYSYLGSMAKDSAGSDYTTGFMNISGEENRQLSDGLAKLFATEFSVLNPNQKLKNTYMGFYNNMVGDMATVGNIYKNTAEAESLTVDSIEASRQAVIGVSDNEELNNMIMYQNAYNASSRYINVVNEMLEHIIDRLAG